MQKTLAFSFKMRYNRYICAKIQFDSFDVIRKNER